MCVQQKGRGVYIASCCVHVGLTSWTTPVGPTGTGGRGQNKEGKKNSSLRLISKGT